VEASVGSSCNRRIGRSVINKIEGLEKPTSANPDATIGISKGRTNASIDGVGVYTKVKDCDLEFKGVCIQNCDGGGIKQNKVVVECPNTVESAEVSGIVDVVSVIDGKEKKKKTTGNT